MSFGDPHLTTFFPISHYSSVISILMALIINCVSILSNRIDFSNDPAMPISKPANLANSAVLKMLEEQEEQRRQGVDSGR